jgi:hypothetical protein
MVTVKRYLRNSCLFATEVSESTLPIASWVVFQLRGHGVPAEIRHVKLYGEVLSVWSVCLLKHQNMYGMVVSGCRCGWGHCKGPGDCICRPRSQGLVQKSDMCVLCKTVWRDAERSACVLLDMYGMVDMAEGVVGDLGAH